MTLPRHDHCVRSLKQSWFRRPMSWVGVLVLACFPGYGRAQERLDAVPLSPHDAKWIQQIVDDYRGQLGISENVNVTIVANNALLTSVERTDDHTFVLSVEEPFLVGLTADDVRAVVAHELGHVWIFTHHPYLQTEGLANDIARRIVTREHLVHVYEKLWQRQGTTGDLARLVGD